jgi:putative hemolysin
VDGEEGTMNRFLLVVFSLGMLVLAACGGTETPATDVPSVEESEPTVGLPNPASVHCEEQGYKLEMREEAGGTVGYCLFPDGSECEEWAYYRGECGPKGEGAGMPNPASVHCEEQGYTLEIRDEAGGQVGYCIFPDGSECEEWAFFRGECGPQEEGAGMPNPASVHCEEQGYKLEIRDEAGGQVGYCIFPDGSECEEWAFFRGECKPATSP